MSRRPFEPSPSAAVEIRREGARRLVFVRELRHPPEAVWAALTDPEELRAWAPFDADRNLAMGGEAVLTMAGGSGDEKLPAVVRTAVPPSVLEYTWGNDVLRWELAPTPAGTRLTLFHTVEDESFLPMVGAGWHICVDVMDRKLAGTPVGRIVADEARQYGWESLKEEYAARLAGSC